MTKEQKIIRAKVGLLELARQLGNVSQACKMMGYSRDSFYRFKELYDAGGELALQELTRRKPILKNRTPPDVEAIIVELSLDRPAYGQIRIANELRKLGHSISPAGVRGVWQRHDRHAYRLAGQDALAVRASKRLRNEELLVPALAGTRLRMELDRIPLWRGDNVAIKQLAEDFARYLYLPRLKDPQVLAAAVQDGLSLLLWQTESFAYADSFDEPAGRYRGLRCGQQLVGSLDSLAGLLVKPDVAVRQQAADAAPKPRPSTGEDSGEHPGGQPIPSGDGATPGRPIARTPKRFHGAVVVDPARVGRDAGRIADEVISHLVGLVGSEVTVTIEIEARIPSGAPDNVVRTVTENSRTLKFTSQGFEED